MTSSSTAGTSPEIHGKRAGKLVGLRCNVAALANAIRTAHERGVRKESYEDFKLARLRVRAAPLPTKVAERLNHFGAHASTARTTVPVVRSPSLKMRAQIVSRVFKASAAAVSTSFCWYRIASTAPRAK